MTYGRIVFRNIREIVIDRYNYKGLSPALNHVLQTMSTSHDETSGKTTIKFINKSLCLPHEKIINCLKDFTISALYGYW